MKKKKKRSLMNRLLSRKVLISLQMIISVIFLGYVYILKILPLKYYLILIMIMILLILLTTIFMRSGWKKKKKSGNYFRLIISKITCLLLSVVLVFLTIAIARGNSFINHITNSFIQTRVISVYVPKESSYTSLEDLKNIEIGIQTTKDNSTMMSALSKIEDEMGSELKTKDFNDYARLGDAISNREVEAIVVDQAYMALLETNHEGIDEQLRSVYKVETEEKVKNVTEEANITKEPFIVYVTGIDTYGTVSTISRTDVNLLVCVNPNSRQILMVSIPRDTLVTLHSKGKKDKLTHSAMYGIDETITTIEDFLNIDINYYAKTNFSGITNIIDALGGVTIDSPYEFDTMHGNYHIKKGKNEMDGNKALCFVRERYALPAGDFDRGRNQQRLLQAMIKKALSPKIITNYNNILAAIEGCFETNMSGSDIKSFINMQLDKGGTWTMYNVQINGNMKKSSTTYSMPGKKVSVIEADSK
ncbi:MAG: LCP family protein, partial [Faecalibacillus sp.]